MTNEQIIAKARQMYCTDDVEIDDNPALSHADDGTWVQAWVYVSTGEEDVLEKASD